MDLTEELVSLSRRPVPDSGPEPGLAYLDDADYDRLVDEALRTKPEVGPLWVFAYGSLIWKPEIEHVEERVALARGVHRAFCLTMTRWRGTAAEPGLMLGLMPGGRCEGMAFRMPAGDQRAQLHLLLRREMTAKPTTYRARWLRLATAQGAVAALGFVANPKGRAFAGRLDEDYVAERLARACGHVGSGADYLFNTVRHLEARGIHDAALWRLQAKVARALREAQASRADGVPSARPVADATSADGGGFAGSGRSG